MGGLGFDDIVTSSPTKKQQKDRLRPIKDDDDDEAIVGLGFEIETSSSSSKKKKDRYRDAPSPKSILDRDALIEALNSHNILLKDGQLDMFYAVHIAVAILPI